MSGTTPGPSRTALRWLRTLRIVRRRVHDSVPSRRFLLVVTPDDAECGLPVHVESGGERDGEHWVLVEKGGEVVRRMGVPCLLTVHDLDEPGIEPGTVTCLRLDAEGHVVTDPPDADAPEAGTDGSVPPVPTDSAIGPGALFAEHRRTGEPLDADEVAAIVAAGFARAEEFDTTGGGLWWHGRSWPEPADEVHDPHVVHAGDPCPVCGGTVVVDGTRRYMGVPVHADGTDTGEAADGGDFLCDESGPRCRECGHSVRVER